MNPSTLWPFRLTVGHSRNPRSGACLMDAVSWFEHGCLDDAPPCVSPVLTAIAQAANDWSNDADRQTLRRFIPLLPGTVDEEADRLRADYLGFCIHRLLGDWRARIPDLDGIQWWTGSRESVTVTKLACLSKLLRRHRILQRYKRLTLPSVRDFDFSVSASVSSSVVETVTFADNCAAMARDALEIGCAIGRREMVWDASRAPQRVRAFAKAREVGVSG